MWLSEAVVKPYVFLRGLLLLAGDIERNPGPVQGRQRATSWQYNVQGTHTVACSGFDKYTSWRVGGVDAWLSDFGQKKLRVVSVGYLPLWGNTSPAVLWLLYICYT